MLAFGFIFWITLIEVEVEFRDTKSTTSNAATDSNLNFSLKAGLFGPLLTYLSDVKVTISISPYSFAFFKL